MQMHDKALEPLATSELLFLMVLFGLSSSVLRRLLMVQIYLKHKELEPSQSYTLELSSCVGKARLIFKHAKVQNTTFGVLDCPELGVAVVSIQLT